MRKIIFACLVAVCAGHAHAQTPGSIIAPVAAGVVAKDVLDDLNDKLTARITQATVAGDFVMEKGARELQLLLANADTVLKGNIDRTFDKLTLQQQQFLRSAVELTNKLDGLADKTLSIEQFAAMDLNTLVGMLPFVDGDKFLLRRVNGYSQIFRGKGVYTIKFTGQAFKNGRRVLVSVNGQAIQLLPFASDYVAVAEIPVELVNPLFKDKEVGRIKVRVQSWNKRTYLGKLVAGAEKRVLDYETDMLLLPKKPVTFELSEITAGKGWSKDVYTVTGKQLASPTGKSGRWMQYEVSATIPSGTLMVKDRTRTWVSAGVQPGPWGNWAEDVRFTDIGENGPTRAARVFAHQIHDQSRMLEMEVAYRKPVIAEGRRHVVLKEVLSGQEAGDGLSYDSLYEGTFSEEYAGYYLRLRLFNGKEYTLDAQTPGPVGIDVRPNIQSAIKKVTVLLKNPYE
jgi:hypothetical protein